MKNRFDLDDFDDDDYAPGQQARQDERYSDYRTQPYAYSAQKAGLSAWVYFLVIFLFGGGAVFAYFYIDKPQNMRAGISAPITGSTQIAPPTNSTGGINIPLPTLLPIPTTSTGGGLLPSLQPIVPTATPLFGGIPAIPWFATATPLPESSGSSGGSSSSSVSVGSTINISEVTEIRETYEGLTAIQIDNRWGFINQNNVVMIAPVYESVTNFINNIAVAKIDGRTVIINPSGDIIEQEPDVVVCAIFEIISASLDYKIVNLTQVNQYQSFFDSILVAIQTDNWNFITEDQFMSLIEWILDLVVQLIILGWNIGLELMRQIQRLA